MNTPKIRELKKQIPIIILMILLHFAFTFASLSYCNSQVLNTAFQVEASEIGVGAYPFYRLVTLGAIRTYQKLISPSRGSECPMHPHCSLYGYMVFEKYNLFRAYLMTADRLHRCGHDLYNYETIELNEYVRFYDPPYTTITNNNEEEPVFQTISSHDILDRDQDNLLNRTDYKNNILRKNDFRLFEFAESLNRAGKYDRAIIEYQRLLFYYPNSEYKGKATKAILVCYVEDRKYLDAIHWGQNILTQNIESIDINEIKYYMGISYYKVRNFNIAQSYFEQISSSRTPSFKEKAQLLQGLSFANMENWGKAERAFSVVGKNSNYFEIAKQNEMLSRRGKTLKYKNPMLAGFLAIIPGLGYLYNGYKQTALSAFIVNGLFIWASFEGFQKNNVSTGSILGVLSFGWYTGNIYGSVISAKRKNIKTVNDHLLKFNVGFKF